jgi:hypothetical protein
MLDRFGHGFQRPNDLGVGFSVNGNSHDMQKTVPPYRRGTMPDYTFDPALNYSVLIDNGIDYEHTEFLTKFNNCHVLKTCYNSKSWPVIAYTLIAKAMESDLQKELPVDQEHWPTDEDWAVREKYFLYLTEHEYKDLWRADDQFSSIDIASLWDYQVLVDQLTSANIKLEDFAEHHQDWQALNDKYFRPIHQAQTIIDLVKQKTHQDISHITDLWNQAVVNYYIWLEYNIVVPANTYANWFSNTKEIEDLINGI